MAFRELEEGFAGNGHDHQLGQGTVGDPRRQPETAGGCSYPGGCSCDGFLGYEALCGNCNHNASFHY